ncbi:hypothetical protein [Rahnella sp. PCH160]|uniref:hypothetical protein n=1 Tax=Rahnella sp. PCH160 TaxID=3447928 RepID=UPI0039FD0753
MAVSKTREEVAMTITEMLDKKRSLIEVCKKVERVMEEADAGRALYIYEYDRTEIRIQLPRDKLYPLLQEEFERLQAQLKIIIDAEQTAERVIAGLLPK